MEDDSQSAGKVTLVLDLDEPASAILPALKRLSVLKTGASFHEVHDRRHPLGIYNLSVGRICEKVQRCAASLEQFWLNSPNLSGLRAETKLRGAVIDYLELCLYAAAEHVDDVETIAKCFFRSGYQAEKSSSMRSLKRAIKPLRDRISSLTNTMKHGQGRLRLFSFEFRHDGNDVCLHGFFVEGFADGQICPNKILHDSGEVVVSITSFLWSILTYLWQISIELQRFLTVISAVDEREADAVEVQSFRGAVVALARLPLYSLDDLHPFQAVRVIIRASSASDKELDSDIYGSLRRRWSKSNQGDLGAWQLAYEGDGVSRSFKLVTPRQLHLQHWD